MRAWCVTLQRMIERVTIQKFKSIRHAVLELGRVNVFIGANGSGKSNLLEAIGVLGAAASGQVDHEALLRRGVRPGLGALYKSSFRRERLPPQIGLKAESASAEYEVHLRNPTRPGSTAWTYHTERLFQDGARVAGRSPRSKDIGDPTRGKVALALADLDPDEPAARLVHNLADYCVYAPNTATMRGLVPDPQQRVPVGLSGGRLAEAFRETRKHLHKYEDDDDDSVAEAIGLLDWVEDIAAGAPELGMLAPTVPSLRQVLLFRDRFMATGRNRLSAYDASEGALFVVFALVVANHPETVGMYAIDNIDMALNPRLARALMAALVRWLTSWDADPAPQVMLTAHNPASLDGLPLDDDDVRLFTVSRSARRGDTQVRRIVVTERIKTLAEKGWPLSRMWVEGEIGGVPNL